MKNTRIRGVAQLLLCLFLLLAGCAQGDKSYVAASLEKDFETGAEMDRDAVALVSGADLANGSDARNAGPSKNVRKIVCTSEIHLTVKDFAVFEPDLAQLIQAHDGFAAERVTDRRHKDHRGGTWVIRVPVDQYDAFLSGVSSLGFATSRTETADDVTEAYVDLKARISNKQKLENRIVQMLDERAGKLEEMMQIERELARVREEIERMQGRLRVLTDQTSLATITVIVPEQARYEPPSAPTVMERLASAWGTSIGSMTSIGTSILIAGVAILPWAAILLPILMVGYRVRGRVASMLA